MEAITRVLTVPTLDDRNVRLEPLSIGHLEVDLDSAGARHGRGM